MEIPSFKDICRADITRSFLDPEVFGEEHTINGKPMVIVLDDMENVEREKRVESRMDGIYVRRVLIYVSAEDFGSLPPHGNVLTLDGKKYTVADTADESGVYSITLERNRNRV